jgi:hypothetical protein
MVSLCKCRKPRSPRNNHKLRALTDTLSGLIAAIPTISYVFSLACGLGYLISIWLAYRSAQFGRRYLFILTHENFQGLLSGVHQSPSAESAYPAAESLGELQGKEKVL